MNISNLKVFGKYGLESIAIVGSVLFSFYLEDLRIKNEKTNYKNELVLSLKAIVDEDLISIQNIKDLQNRNITCHCPIKFKDTMKKLEP